MKKKRWTWLVITFAIITVLLYFWLFVGFPDHWDGDPPATHFEKVIKILCIVLGFPAVIVLKILSSDPPFYISYILKICFFPMLVIGSGLFWGSIAEFFCIVKDKYKRKHPIA